MIDSKTFSCSNVIQDLAEFLCTICEADFNTIEEYYGFVIEEKKSKNCRLNMHRLLKE
jgi:hypothetical protein